MSLRSELTGALRREGLPVVRRNEVLDVLALVPVTATSLGYPPSARSRSDSSSVTIRRIELTDERVAAAGSGGRRTTSGS